QSASPACMATSSSFRNSPLPPIAASERSSTSSPRVLSGTSSTVRPGWCARRAWATCSLCHRASGLLRVAMRRRSVAALAANAGSWRASEPTLGLAQLRHTPATDLRGTVTVSEHGVYVAVDIAPQLDQLMARNQKVAVDAQEAFAELV